MTGAARAPRHLFCVGAQKAGTSWLYSYLRSHPEVHVSEVKEMHFFNVLFDPRAAGFREMRKALLNEWQARGAEAFATFRRGTPPGDLKTLGMLEALVAMYRDDPQGDFPGYRAAVLRDHDGAPVVADLTPDYCVLRAPQFARMVDAFPEAQFLAILRDPLARTWSNLRMHHVWMQQVHKSSDSFEALVAAYLDGRHDHIDQRSDYAHLLEALEASVPCDRQKTLFYERLFSDAAMAELTDWLGVAFRPGDYGTRVRQGQARAITPALADAVRVRLLPVYAAMLERFGADLPVEWDRTALDMVRVRKAAHARRRSDARGLPVTFVVGADGAGRTWWHSLLRRHAACRVSVADGLSGEAQRDGAAAYLRAAMPLLSQDTPRARADMDDLVARADALMGGQAESLTQTAPGQTCAIDLSPDLLRRLEQRLAEHPGARVVFVLRNPVARFLQLALARGRAEGAPDEALVATLREALSDAGNAARTLTRIDTAMAVAQAALPPERIHYVDAEQLATPSEGNEINRLWTFLNVSPDDVAPVSAPPSDVFARDNLALAKRAGLVAQCAQQFDTTYDACARALGAHGSVTWKRAHLATDG